MFELSGSLFSKLVFFCANSFPTLGDSRKLLPKDFILWPGILLKKKWQGKTQPQLALLTIGFS